MERDGSDLPEGIANAEPTGGWGGAGDTGVDGGGTASNDEKEAQDAADRGRDLGDPDTDPDGSSDQFVESAEIQQGLDPDVLTDDQAEERAD